MKRRILEEMPMNRNFNRYSDGREESCEATGYEVDLEDGSGWWNEFADSEGELHYGR